MRYTNNFRVRCGGWFCLAAVAKAAGASMYKFCCEGCRRKFMVGKGPGWQLGICRPAFGTCDTCGRPIDHKYKPGPGFPGYPAGHPAGGSGPVRIQP